MYSIYVSTLAKLKLLICFIRNSINANYFLTLLTYLSMFIVVMKLLNPVYNVIMNLIGKYMGKKNDKSSSHRKYKKINSITNSCSACGSSNSSSSSYCSRSSDSNKPNKPNKSNKKNKCKVKLNKNKINKTLREFKLD
jgi:hypothetical protein